MARLLLQTVEGPRTIELRAHNTLGRHPGSTIQVLDRIVSKEHCVIELKEGRFLLRDRGSMNGTYVNGERAHAPVVLSDGDEIALGATRAIFHAGVMPELGPSLEPKIIEAPSERILVHLAIDKVVYRPGETLYARAVVLDAVTGARAGATNLLFEVIAPQGDPLASRLGHAAEGVAPFSWTIAADLCEGSYTLVARCPTETFPPTELRFLVRATQPILSTGAPALRAVAERTDAAPSGILLTLHPEGGELTLGLASRVYVEARTPLGAPAEVVGRIVDPQGTTMARFHTEHEGRGRVLITPRKAGRGYQAVIDEPAGEGDAFPLPEVRRDGLSLLALDDRVEADEALHVRIASTAAEAVTLAVYRRDQEVATASMHLAPGRQEDVSLAVPANATGVLRVQLRDAAGQPRAERLVFRRPRVALRVEIEALPTHPSPGGPLAVRVRTTLRGKPVSATVTIAVGDAPPSRAVGTRDRAPRLPEQVLLANEVSELADPSAYLGEGAGAARRLDLLLGVQSFRRFAFVDVARFLAEHGDRAERVIARRRLARVPATQAVSLPETAPSGPPGRGRGTEASERLKPLATDAAALPPLPGPPLLMGIPGAQRAGSAADRGRVPVVAGAVPPVGKMVNVREHAYRRGGDGPAPRAGETLFWCAGISTSVNGEVTVELDVPEHASRLQVRADAFTTEGALGVGDATIELLRPFLLEVRLPHEVGAGDVIDVPIAVINATIERLDGRLSFEAFGPLIASRESIPFSVAPEGRERIYLPVAVTSGRGPASLQLRAVAGPHEDAFEVDLAVSPTGSVSALRRAGAAGPGEVAGGLLLATTLGAEDVDEGEIVELTVVVTNHGAHDHPAVTVVIGMPAGLEVTAAVLDAWRASDVIDRCELRGREVMVALRGLSAGGEERFTIPVIGAVPGTYRGPPSRAYVGDVHHDAVIAAPLAIRVVARP